LGASRSDAAVDCFAFDPVCWNLFSLSLRKARGALSVWGVEWRAGIALWNLLGLADILAVAATAARLEVAVPGSMH
jgi:hypothetical protein